MHAKSGDDELARRDGSSAERDARYIKKRRHDDGEGGGTQGMSRSEIMGRSDTTIHLQYAGGYQSSECAAHCTGFIINRWRLCCTFSYLSAERL